MQLRSKITVARNIGIHHHKFVKRKAQNAVVLNLEVADGMVKTTFKQLGNGFNSIYMASDFYPSIWTCWNTELQRVQVNQCQFCVLKPKKNLALPSFLVVCSCSLFSTCLDCFMIFAPTRHECVIVLLIAPAPFHCALFYALSWYFEVESLPDKTYCLFNFNDRYDDRWKKFQIVNTTLNAQA